MRGIAEEREAPGPDTPDQFTEEDAECDNHSELEFLLEMRLMATLRIAVMMVVMVMIVTVMVHAVSLKDMSGLLLIRRFAL